MVAAGLISRALSTSGHEPLRALRPIAGVVAVAAYLPAYRSMLAARASRPSSYWLSAAVGLAVAGAWTALELHSPAGGEAHRSPGDGVLWLAIRVATAILLVPVTEELAFRGFLARRLSSRSFDTLWPRQITWPAILVSSLAFGLLHHRPVAGTLAGLCYALVFRRRGAISDAIVAHAVTNAALVAIAFAETTTHGWNRGFWQ
jgi:CAAX prenyl protease-like protein